ncbi:hypothetical protein DVH05_008863 [Phytophthora capsici]|nr:hypothetical protein DVH05_008863 [Phytophthora capsici]
MTPAYNKFIAGNLLLPHGGAGYDNVKRGRIGAAPESHHTHVVTRRLKRGASRRRKRSSVSWEVTNDLTNEERIERDLAVGATVALEITGVEPNEPIQEEEGTVPELHA